MKKKIVIVALVTLLTLGIGQGVLAFGPRFSPSSGLELGLGRQWGYCGRMPGSQIDDKLGLTAEQQKQVAELRLQYLEKTQDLSLLHERLRVELQALWSGEELDTETIAAKEAELAKVRVQLVQMSRELQKEAKKLYTAEQLEVLETQPWGQRQQRNEGKGRGMSMGRGGCPRH